MESNFLMCEECTECSDRVQYRKDIDEWGTWLCDRCYREQKVEL